MTGRMFGHQCEAKARLAQTRWNARTNTAEADDQPSRSRHAWTRRVKSLRFTLRARGADRRTLRMLDEHEDWSACKQRYCGDGFGSSSRQQCWPDRGRQPFAENETVAGLEPAAHCIRRVRQGASATMMIRRDVSSSGRRSQSPYTWVISKPAAWTWLLSTLSSRNAKAASSVTVSPVLLRRLTTRRVRCRLGRGSGSGGRRETHTDRSRRCHRTR